MSNKKAQIAEVLFSDKCTMSTENIMFILSHIPDENNNDSAGPYQQKVKSEIKFDHKANSFFKACGISIEEVDRTGKKILQALTGCDTLSEGAEKLLKFAEEDPKNNLLIVIHCLKQAQSLMKAQELGITPEDLLKAKSFKIDSSDLGPAQAKKLGGYLIRKLMQLGNLSREQVKEKLNISDEMLDDLLNNSKDFES